MGSLGKGHRGTAGPDTLRGKFCLPDLSQQTSQDLLAAHSLHTSPTVLRACPMLWGSYLGHRFLLQLLWFPQ